ncbi:VirB4 family type IV secretion/conjugal transfer ATPase [Legionella pneumophila serogroup 1]
MNPIKSLKQNNNEMGVSCYFPVTHLCTPSVFETKAGFLGAVLNVEGVPYVTATEEELNQSQRLFHQALNKLSHDFIIYETIVRRKKDFHLQGEFSDGFAKQVNDKYFKRFESAGLYENKIYLTLIYKNEHKPEKLSLTDRIIHFSKALSDKTVKSAKSDRREKGIQILLNKISELQSILAHAKPRLLGENDDQLGYSELISFLSIIPNGDEATQLNPLLNPHPIGSRPKNIIDINKQYPKGHLGQYICNKRLFFGNNIQYQGNTSQAQRFAAIMSLKQYGSNTANVILDPLLNLDGEFVLTQSFAPIARERSLAEIDRAFGVKINAEDKGASQIHELNDLSDLVASEKVSCGFHHNSLMLLADNQQDLEPLINEASKAYALANMHLVKETLAQTAAFFAQIPGNTHFIPRRALITSENFADFCSLHNAQTGHHQQNFLDSAVSLIETPAKTPVYFNYHAKGSKTNPSRGHALIIGGNDSGKTTTVSFLDSQMARFPGHRSIFIDRNNGLKVYILAMGGKYITVSPKHANQCKMNPLKLEDSALNRDFAKKWFQSLLVQETETMLPSTIAEIANDAIDYCFESLTPESRQLSNIAKFLPLDFPRMAELRRWLKGDDTRGDGQYAWLFDNEEDVIHLDSTRIGFDVTYILDALSPQVATPLFMYIMHRIEMCLNGSVTSIIVDEMWQVLRTPYWRGWLEERLPSIRKEYGHIIGMTQSPKTIVESDISAELLDNVTTLILFPNPKAERSIYVERLGLSDTEFDFIKNNSPQSRLFLYKHDTESIICRLDLSDLSDEIRVFSANTASVQLMERIIKEKGETPSDWLPTFIERSKAK